MLKNSADGVIISVRVIPNASRDEIKPESEFLKIKITVQPEKGKANRAVIKILSKKLGVSSSALEIISGETAKNKKILIRGADSKIISALLGI